MKRLLQYGARVARTPYAVVIEGETGTGKELFARGIHASSGRGGPFVPLDCSAVPAQMFDAELFGTRRGAYASPDSERPGLFRVASGGTLFLDEIAHLPASTQAELLRVLEDGRVRPPGSDTDIAVDVRVVAATPRSLVGLVEEGRFRSDLFLRLAAVSIRLPPLRERAEDIAMLVRDAVLEACSLQQVPRRMVEAETMALLMTYPWPGNIRELRDVMAAAVLHSTSDTIHPGDLPPNIRTAGSVVAGEPEPSGGDRGRRVAVDLRQPFFSALEEFESSYLAILLGRTHGNLSEAARQSGLSRSAVRNKARHYGLLGAPAEREGRRKRVRMPSTASHR